MGVQITSTTLTQVLPVGLLLLQWDGVEDMNVSIAELVLHHRSRHPTVRMSNAGGWQSEKTFHEWNHPAVHQLIEMIHCASTMYGTQLGLESPDLVDATQRIVAWANVNGSGDYNRLHYHGGALWSGVYFPSVDFACHGDEYDGALVFRGPVQTSLLLSSMPSKPWLKRLFPTDLRIAPQDGLMVVFPAWLEHQVFPFREAGCRISISWDVVIPRAV